MKTSCNYYHRNHDRYDYYHSISIGDGDNENNPNNTRNILNRIEEIATQDCRFQNNFADKLKLRLEIRLGASFTSEKRCQSHYRYAITADIADSLVDLFSTLEKSERFTAFVSLEMEPTISDDDNFRRILKAIAMTNSSSLSKVNLQDIRLRGYGRCYPFGTLGCSFGNSSMFPSLWDIIATSDSVDTLEIAFHDGDENDENEHKTLDNSIVTNDHHQYPSSRGGSRIKTADQIQSYSCWKAISSNASLRSLSVKLYSNNYKYLEGVNLENHQTQNAVSQGVTTTFVRTREHLVRGLSTSLRNHSTIQQLQIYCHKDNVCLESLLVPHIRDLLLNGGSGNRSDGCFLSEIKLECFAMALNGWGQVLRRNNITRQRHHHRRRVQHYHTKRREESVHGTDEPLFPIPEFVKALTSATTPMIKVLRLCNVGLVTWQANELIRSLPSTVKNLDLSNNDLEQFPSTTRITNKFGCNSACSELVELNLWNNPCLYTQEQIASLQHINNLLVAFPCLASLGPWDEWQCFKSQKRLMEYKQQQEQQHRDGNSSGRANNGGNEMDDTDSALPLTTVNTNDLIGFSCLRKLVDTIVANADRNRFKVHFLSRSSILSECPSLWPIVLARITLTASWKEKHQGQQDSTAQSRTSEEEMNAGFVSSSSRETAATDCRRQANVLFSLIRENSTRGIYCR